MPLKRERERISNLSTSEMHCVNSYSDEVTFYEGETRVISNGTSLRVQFDYNFTEGSQAGLNYTEDGILFSNNGTRLIW